LQTFETEMLAEEENFPSLARINRELIGKAASATDKAPLTIAFSRGQVYIIGGAESP
jgi:hypothetical protein